MTISPQPVLLGAQRPRYRSVPPAETSAGAEAIGLAASAGLTLDPWQRYALDDTLGEREDGRWASPRVGIVVPRQNGKGGILEARELAGLFLFGEKLILHSAHEFKTAQEAFRRVLGLIENTDHLRKRVSRVRTSHGEEGVELRDGARLRFVARSTGSGRGFTGDLVILDEAYNLSPEAMAALLPTLSARPNPQVWYTSSAPLLTSDVLRKLCLAGRAGEKRLAYLEWCSPPETASGDRQGWADANPALGIRITEEAIEMELAALGDEEFRRERLGIWSETGEQSLIDIALWASLADRSSTAQNPVGFAVDVTPDRSASTIGVAGRRSDRMWHVEAVDHRPGTGWVVERMKDLQARWQPCGIAIDAAGPAGALVTDLQAAGIDVTLYSARDSAAAAGEMFDDITEKRLRHIDQPELNAAVAGAKQRPLGEAWGWSRKNSAVDISPLVAVSLARHMSAIQPGPYDLLNSVQIG